MFDVIAVNIETNEIRLIAENKSDRNAEAIENMAVLRRGVKHEFFATVPHGKYKNGDSWQ
jgi:hypothetical protein